MVDAPEGTQVSESARFDHVLRDAFFKPVVETTRDGPPRFRMFVGGAWVAVRREPLVDSPIDGSTIASVPSAAPEDVERAIEAAHEGRRAIRDVPGHRRVELFGAPHQRGGGGPRGGPRLGRAGQGCATPCGGGRRGRFIEPAVLAGVTPEMRILHEETFGPVLPIARVRSEEEALEYATWTQYGLDACVFGRSFEHLWRAAKRIDCGEVTLNDLPRHGVGHFPFGGQRDSGVGREGIGYSVDDMTELKTIAFALPPRRGSVPGLTRHDGPSEPVRAET